MGTWRHRQNASSHKRIRAETLAATPPGTLCCICHHELNGEIHLDHADDGTYRGLAHGSPCTTCGRRCNQSEGGKKAALEAGKRLRERECVICGTPYKASRGSAGARTQTCGADRCVSELRRRRRAGEDDGEAPPRDSRPW